MKIKLCAIALLSALFLGVGVRAQEPSSHDTLQVSLLTCGPGTEVYELFGHTALRVRELSPQGFDWVFNYGMFDFNAPAFVWRFTKGETDYCLGVNDFPDFLLNYVVRESRVDEQILNLTPEESWALFEALKKNALPENRVYRYNFFYDNCATRPRDQVEKAVDKRLHYAEDMETTDTGVSFRDIVHQHCQDHPWSSFGIDFCLGSLADRPINRRQMMFAPFYLKDFMATAMLTDSAGVASIPLVSATEQIVRIPEEAKEVGSFVPTPLQASLLLLVLIVIVTLWGLRKGKVWWGIDLVLFLLAGIGGCFLFLLSFFSQHPTVNPNYLLFVLHPLHLCVLPFMLYKVIKRRLSYYMCANLVTLTLFIVFWGVIPQNIHPAILPLALCLLIRSANSIIIYRKQTKR